MRTSIVLLLLAAFTQAQDFGTIVYRSAFDRGVVDERWQGAKLVEAEHALSRGGIAVESDRPLTLRLDGIEAFRFLRVRMHLDVVTKMDMAVIDPFGDGAPLTNTANRLRVTTASGQTVLDSTFSDGTFYQASWPDRAPHFMHMVVGVTFQDPGMWMGGVQEETKMRIRYPMEFVIPHSGGDAAWTFRASEMTPHWSISEIEVVGLREAPTRWSKELGERLYKSLNNRNPHVAADALRAFAGAGTPALDFLEQRYPGSDVAATAERVAQLVTELDHESFKTRRAAERTLVEMGPAVKPLVEQALRHPDLPPEAKARLQNVRKELTPENGLEDQARINRLHQLLGLVGGDRAGAIAARLPPPAHMGNPMAEMMEQMQIDVDFDINLPEILNEGAIEIAPEAVPEAVPAPAPAEE